MIKVEASKKDGYAQVSIDGVKALDCADEIGNIVRALTKAFLKPVPQEIQTEFAEILKTSIVGGYREGMKEAQHETVD